MPFTFGSTLMDKITGFTGIATGKASYITGCDQYLIAPPVKGNHEFTEARWYDEARLQVVEVDTIILGDVQGDLPGADSSAPIK